MSLRCSLLGHEYGESEIERDREERGDEVVISVTELERCRRCGNARTISENTEVTQRSPGNAPRTDDTAEVPESATRPGTEEPLDATPTADSSLDADSNPGVGSSPDLGVDLDSDSGADDAEILDAEASEDESPREPGAWPEHDRPVGDQPVDAEGGSGGSAGTTEWPSVDAEDEGFDAAVPDGERTDVEFGGGLTPQSVDRGAEILEDVASRDERERNADAEFVRAGAPISPDVEGETELYCPNCDTSDLDERDSLRAGDICPVCHRGYLAERER